MSDVEHSAITDPYVHESKGVAAAAANTVPVCNGAATTIMTDVAALMNTNKNYIGAIQIVEVTATRAALASAGTVSVVAAASGKQYKIRGIRLSGSATSFSGGGGNRLLSLTDNTSTWTVIPAATLQALGTAGQWGDAAVPYPATVAHLTTACVANTAIVLKYSGGTTDYSTNGSITLIITYERTA